MTDVGALHREVEEKAGKLHLLHSARLQCRKGCSSCCVDDLTVFEVEAEVIRANHGALLETGAPHPSGACAFLDGEGGCRVYANRPYVCRTQGLPLRWLDELDGDDEHDGEIVERRDICPLNEAGTPIEDLPAAECWTLGPVEEALVELQMKRDAKAPRTKLRDLFARR